MKSSQSLMATLLLVTISCTHGSEKQDAKKGEELSPILEHTNELSGGSAAAPGPNDSQGKICYRYGIAFKPVHHIPRNKNDHRFSGHLECSEDSAVENCCVACNAPRSKKNVTGLPPDDIVPVKTCDRLVVAQTDIPKWFTAMTWALTGAGLAPFVVIFLVAWKEDFSVLHFDPDSAIQVGDASSPPRSPNIVAFNPTFGENAAGDAVQPRAAETQPAVV